MQILLILETLERFAHLLAQRGLVERKVGGESDEAVVNTQLGSMERDLVAQWKWKAGFQAARQLRAEKSFGERRELGDRSWRNAADRAAMKSNDESSQFNVAAHSTGACLQLNVTETILK